MKDLLSRRRLLAAALIVTALVAAGCSKDNNTTTNPPPNAGIGQNAADDVAMQTSAALVPTSLDLTSAMSGSDTTSFLGHGILRGWTTVDTTFTRGGFTVHVTRTFFDSTNAVIAMFDSTARTMVWTSQIHGGRSNANDSLVVGHAAVFTFSGLQDSVLTLNGSALDSLFHKFQKLNGDTTRFVFSTSTMTATNVKLPRDGVRLFPLSGTLTFTIVARRLNSANPADVAQTVNATVVVTFNGTSTVNLVVNGTFHYTWNMVTGVITRVV